MARFFYVLLLYGMNLQRGTFKRWINGENVVVWCLVLGVVCLQMVTPWSLSSSSFDSDDAMTKKPFHCLRLCNCGALSISFSQTVISPVSTSTQKTLFLRTSISVSSHYYLVVLIKCDKKTTRSTSNIQKRSRSVSRHQTDIRTEVVLPGTSK